ncbi:MAG: hypothetical protein E6J69_13315 [Deltaproteobacteria bacterium]|nr:MAG: hypothetical protein E6J69_13315 [Deltaproteobacteria bacterium]
MRAALLGLLGLVTSTTLAGAAAPPVVPWQEAGRHVGEVVTVEGMVAAAHGTGDTCVLEFAPDDPHALRVILLLPMFSSLPPKPERLYAEKRVRASGLVRRFAGRLEMVLRSPTQIEVVDVAGQPTAAAPPEPPPEKPPRALSEAVARQLAAAAPCERARARWRDAAGTAGELSTALGRCLESGSYRCRRESAALAPALTALEWAEQQVEEACR